LLPREERFNPIRELWGFFRTGKERGFFGIPKKKARKMQHSVAKGINPRIVHRMETDNPSSGREKKRRRAKKKVLKGYADQHQNACDPNEPLPRQDWGRGRRRSNQSDSQ